MKSMVAFKEIFIFFLKRGLKAKRTKLFFFIALGPVVILFIAKLVVIFNPNAQISITDIISKILMIVYIQLLIPVMALFFGTSVVNEEVDNRTLVFLTSTPVSKHSFIFGKYFSSALLSSIIISFPLVLSFLIINITRLNRMGYYHEFFLFLVVGILALFSYTALFLCLGTLFKKSLLMGLLFIFGWESIVQYFPGSTQKLTLIHFVKSLLPETSENVKFLVLKLEPSPVLESVLALLLVMIIGLLLASFIFNRKEYILTDTGQ
jgi:ABC-2 type transport system permease protein